VRCCCHPPTFPKLRICNERVSQDTYTLRVIILILHPSLPPPPLPTRYPLHFTVIICRCTAPFPAHSLASLRQNCTSTCFQVLNKCTRGRSKERLRPRHTEYENTPCSRSHRSRNRLIAFNNTPYCGRWLSSPSSSSPALLLPPARYATAVSPRCPRRLHLLTIPSTLQSAGGLDFNPLTCLQHCVEITPALLSVRTSAY